MPHYTTAALRGAKALGHPFPEQVETVWQDTWGHLAPKVREVYAGHIVFTLGIHGDITLIHWEFELDDGTCLDGSPWLMEDMMDFVGNEIEKKRNLRGGIWRFDGTFERLKNGKGRWRGKTSPMRLQYRFPKKKARH